MSRVPMLDAAAASKVIAELGLPPHMAQLHPMRVLMRHPDLAKVVLGLLGFLLNRGKLDLRLRELAILRIGWKTNSVYEWAQHWRVAKRDGVDESDMLGVRDWRAYPQFGQAERAILAATDETIDDGCVSAATWKEVEEALPDPSVRIELVVAIGNWIMFSTFLRSLEIPLEDDASPWPPDGLAPAPKISQQ